MRFKVTKFYGKFIQFHKFTSITNQYAGKRNVLCETCETISNEETNDLVTLCIKEGNAVHT